MELRTVNTFLHIAELHSFSRTARQLGYSQSAVSSQIAQLEAELGTPLFDRVGKTVRLTDAGQTFLGYARTLLETAQQAQAALQRHRAVAKTMEAAGEKLAAEISKQACKAGIIMDVLLEVNIGYEESKSGFAPEETEAAVRKIAEMPGISVKGLMAIPPIDPLYENTRKYFRNMYKLFIDIGAKNIDNSSMSVLSMGMSNDFDIAAEEGATIVRVGTALFGKRIYK